MIWDITARAIDEFAEIYNEETLRIQVPVGMVRLAELMGSIYLIFYRSAEDAVIKALGIE